MWKLNAPRQEVAPNRIRRVGRLVGAVRKRVTRERRVPRRA